MDALQTALIDLVVILLTGFAGVVTKKVVEMANASGLSKKLHIKKDSIMIGINAIEKIAINESGPEKKEKAIEYILVLLQESGVKMERKEIDIMIEGMLGAIEEEAKKNFLIESDTKEE